MNINEDTVFATELDKVLERSRATLEMAFGSCSILLATDTMQFADYSRYETDYYDATAKRKRNHEVFPKDLERAFALGKRLTEPLP